MCAGASFEKYEARGKIVDMNGFQNLLNTLTNIEVVTAITAIDLDCKTIIGVFNKALWFGTSMQHSLLLPIQLWNHSVTIDSMLKQYSNGKSLHGIYVHDDDVLIPFHL